jgi:hypothetical protein
VAFEDGAERLAGQAELFEGEDTRRNQPHDDAQIAHAAERRWCGIAGLFAEGIGKVAASLFLELLLESGRRDVLHDALGVGRRQRDRIEAFEGTGEANRRRLAHAQMEVRGVAVDHRLQHLVNVHGHGRSRAPFSLEHRRGRDSQSSWPTSL